MATVASLRGLGVKITLDKASRQAVVYGVGMRGLKKPKGPIKIYESGTTFRLLLGLLAGQEFNTVLESGRQLSKRPMLRVILPLRMMGALLEARVRKDSGRTEEYPPVVIKGSRLKGISYRLPIASAQVKSAILLAALFSQGMTVIKEPVKTRDHTERMLKRFKVKIKCVKGHISMQGGQRLVSPRRIYVPADISSASFFIVAASLLKGSRIVIKNVSLNPTRIGILRLLKKMGADIGIRYRRALAFKGNEPMGDIIVRSSLLKGASLGKGQVPSLIDELPVLMVASSCAKGKSVFEGVEELRVKETDRIKSMSENLKKMGVSFNLLKSGNSSKIVIQGVRQLKSAQLRSFGDHRSAMSLVIAGLCAGSRSRLDDISCIKKSFPGFLKEINSLRA